jgi:aminoglycoside phosphotransferase (APT) family kinase protein
VVEQGPDPHSLLRSLGIEQPTRVTPIGDGWGDTMLWRVEQPDRVSVLRVYPLDQRHVRDREVAVMRAVHDVPVPRVEAVGDPDGYPAIIISWCPGITVFAALSREPNRAEELGTLVGRAHARIHGNAVPDQLTSILRHDWLDWAGDLNGELVRRFDDVMPRETAIIHLDYHPLNVLIDGDSITGIIDWSNAQIGDARADVARTYSILAWIPLPPSESVQIADRTRAQFRRAWLRGYESERGALKDVAPFLAWAALATHRDLSRKIGQAGFWMNDEDFRHLNCRADRWTKLAGLQERRNREEPG